MPDTGTKLRRPATLDHLRKKEPMEKTLDVVLSDAPLEAVRQARSRLALAGEDTKARKAAESELAAAEADLEEHTVTVRFRSIGRRSYDDLIREHPPTDDQKKQHGDDLLYNPDTFPVALVAASCIEPQMTVEDAEGIFETWNGAELTELFYAALGVNTQRRVVELGKDYG